MQVCNKIEVLLSTYMLTAELGCLLPWVYGWVTPATELWSSKHRHHISVSTWISEALKYTALPCLQQYFSDWSCTPQESVRLRLKRTHLFSLFESLPCIRRLPTCQDQIAHNHCIQILGSSRSILHTKVEILRQKWCFLRKKATKLHANLWKTFSTVLFCWRSRWFHVGLLNDLHLAREPRPRPSSAHPAMPCGPVYKRYMKFSFPLRPAVYWRLVEGA